jgi:predicted phosphohydrolase
LNKNDEGTFNIINGNCSHMIGVLSRSDVLNSQKDPAVSYKLAESVYGGDFFKSLKGIANKIKGAHDYIKSNKLVSKIASQIPLPLAQKVANYANQHGYGVSGGRGRRARGGDLTNGSAKDELKRRLAQSDEATESESD